MMFRSVKFQRNVLKVLILVSTIFTFKLVYLTISNHSLRRKDLVVFSPSHRKNFERESIGSIFKNVDSHWNIIDENDDYYVLKIWKKKNGSFLREHDLSSLSYSFKHKKKLKHEKKLRWAKIYNNDKRNASKLIMAKHQKHLIQFSTREKVDKNANKTNNSVDEVKIMKNLSSHCPHNSLRPENNGHGVDYGKCFPHRSSSEDCKIATNWYMLQPSLEQCDDSQTTVICTLDVLHRGGQKKIQATCSEEICNELSPIIVKGLNNSTGENDVLLMTSSVKKLEKELPKIVVSLDYVFLECADYQENLVAQLLPVPPGFSIKENRRTTRPDNIINVNIILLDSVSRAHFYRSLPKTIQLFTNWTREPIHSPAQVFDFELFQAVEGHTAENTHALFTGTLFPADGRDATSRPVGMEKLFGHFQEAEYQTIWQEDLCWKGIWGLFTDLSIAPEWENLGPKLKEVHIDGTGLTHASCEILDKYELTSPFNGPEGNKICFNGKFQHSYYLQHVLDTLKAIKKSRRALPILSYLTLNVGHDQEGLRIQTLDNDLVKYAVEFANQKDTLTVFLADHGNTYTSYTGSTLEGRFEMFHPSLFMMIPNKVANLLGNGAMTALRANQRRLVTMIDLHHTLMTLAIPLGGRVKSTGVFAPIPSDRTCNDVELRTPNLCVCDGWDTSAANDTAKIALVEFAIGRLNNQLQNSLGKDSLSLVGSCIRLKPIRFQNVRERNSQDDGSLVTSLDLVVAAGNVVEQDEDLFRVEIKSKENPNSNTLDYRMIHYERLSMFGKYKKCADKKVNLKLCICNTQRKSVFPKTNMGRLKSMMFESTTFLKATTKVQNIDKEGCVYMIIRRHGNNAAFGYEIVNTCLDQSRDVLLVYSHIPNMRFSTASPLLVTVPPGGITFAFSATQHLSYWKGRQIKVKAVVLS